MTTEQKVEAVVERVEVVPLTPGALAAAEFYRHAESERSAGLLARLVDAAVRAMADDLAQAQLERHEAVRHKSWHYQRGDMAEERAERAEAERDEAVAALDALKRDVILALAKVHQGVTLSGPDSWLAVHLGRALVRLDNRSAGSVPVASQPVPPAAPKGDTTLALAAASKYREALWDAINEYVTTCGGDPSRHVYGNTSRQRAVARVEAALRAALARPEGAHELLRRVAAGGRIVSSNDLTPTEIALARAADRMWVDERGLGYVYLPAPASTAGVERLPCPNCDSGDTDAICECTNPRWVKDPAPGKERTWVRCCAEGCRRKAQWLVTFEGERTGQKFEVPACEKHSQVAEDTAPAPGGGGAR